MSVKNAGGKQPQNVPSVLPEENPSSGQERVLYRKSAGEPAQKSQRIDRFLTAVQQFFRQDVSTFFTQSIPNAFHHVVSSIAHFFRGEKQVAADAALRHIRSAAEQPNQLLNSSREPALVDEPVPDDELNGDRLVKAQTEQIEQDKARREVETAQVRVDAHMKGTWLDLAKTRQLKSIVAEDAINFGKWCESRTSESISLTPVELQSAKAFAEDLVGRYAPGDLAEHKGLREQIDKAKSLLDQFPARIRDAEKRIKDAAAIDALEAEINKVLSQLSPEPGPEAQPEETPQQWKEAYDKSEGIPDQTASEKHLSHQQAFKPASEESDPVYFDDDGITMDDDHEIKPESDIGPDQDDRSLLQKWSDDLSDAIQPLKAAWQSVTDKPLARPFSTDTDEAMARWKEGQSAYSEFLEDRETSEREARQWAEDIRRTTREQVESEPLWKRTTADAQARPLSATPEPIFIPVPENIGPPPPPPPPRQARTVADRTEGAPIPPSTSPAKPKAFKVPELPDFPNIDATTLERALFEDPDFRVDISATLENAVQYFDSLSHAGQVDQENQVFALTLAGFWRAAKQNPVLKPRIENLRGFKDMDKLLDMEAIERNFQ